MRTVIVACSMLLCLASALSAFGREHRADTHRTGTLAAQHLGAQAINRRIQAEYPRARSLKAQDLQVVRRGRTQLRAGGTHSSWAFVTKKLTHALEPAVVIVQVQRLDRRHWKGLKATRVGFIRSR